MPADPGEYQNAFRDMVGTAAADTSWYGERIGDWHEWYELFESTGIDFDSHADTIDAFEMFLISFYPQEGKNADEWDQDRGEFYDEYGISEENIDWDGYREAIGY
jgi:hypothetical protein